MKKAISLILCAALFVSALSGCGGLGEEVDLGLENTASPEPSPESTEAPSSTPGSGDEEPADRDWQALWHSHDMDEVVLTVDGSDVLWDEYFYWIYSNVSDFEAMYGQVDYGAELAEGMTYGDYIMSVVDQYAEQYHALLKGAEELGVSLTDEDWDYLDEQVELYIETYCGEGTTDEEFEELLSESCLTRRMFDFMNETSMLHQRLWIDVYGANGELYPAESALSWGDEQGYTTVKHILILTQDEEGNALDEAAKAEKLAQAEELLSQLEPLSGSEEIETEFDTLMNENSEDPGLASYPGGYCYVPGTMYAEFEDAAAALGDYEVSGIVESTSGYHIILRLPLSVDDVLFDYGYGLGYVAAQLDFNDLISGWVEDAETVPTELYTDFDLAAFLG